MTHTTSFSLINPTLLASITKQFQLPLASIHGLSHWRRVEALGRHLAAPIKADITVVMYFAYLHDSQRINEEHDPNHGERAAVYCKQLMKQQLLTLNANQLKQLLIACKIHSDNRAKTQGVTVATCLDADRLDLIRLGFKPFSGYLFSDEAKRLADSGDEAIQRISKNEG